MPSKEHYYLHLHTIGGNRFKHWGGVGRDVNSFVRLMRDSYPEAFNGWLGDQMLGVLHHEDHPINDPEDSHHGIGSSHFSRYG